MSFRANVGRVDAKDATVTIKQHPDSCPLCHNNLVLNEFKDSLLYDDILQLIYQCPSKKCNRLFIAYYSQGYRGDDFLFQTSLPGKVLVPEVSAEIEKLSPDFVKIFNDSYTAEKLGLDGISGIGYRKALEFIVKDYAIHRLGKDASDIKGKFLGTVIKEDIGDSRLKKAFKLASWLANDETHYARKWKNYNIADLKRLIEIAMRLINDEIDLKNFSESMDKGEGTTE